MQDNFNVIHIYYLHKQIKLYKSWLFTSLFKGSTIKIFKGSQVFTSYFYIEGFSATSSSEFFFRNDPLKIKKKRVFHDVELIKVFLFCLRCN